MMTKTKEIPKFYNYKLLCKVMRENPDLDPIQLYNKYRSALREEKRNDL